MKMRQAPESPYRVLIGPVVTEKSTVLSEARDGRKEVFVFNVARDATKPQIRKAIEEVFSVEVEKVRTHNIKGKPRNMRHRGGGKRFGVRPTQRRAFVSLVKGQTIDFWKFGEGAD